MQDNLAYAPEAPPLPNSAARFALFFLRFYWLPLTVMVFLEAAQAACQILIPYAIKQIIDATTHFAGSFEDGLEVLRPSLILFASLSLGILIFSRASGTLLVIVGPSLRRRVRNTIYHFLQYHSQRFFI